LTIAASAFVSLAMALAIGRKRGGLSVTFEYVAHPTNAHAMRMADDHDVT
jgi:hypothetical protein